VKFNNGPYRTESGGQLGKSLLQISKINGPMLEDSYHKMSGQKIRDRECASFLLSSTRSL